MTDITSPLSLLVRRLAALSALDSDDRAAIMRLPYRWRTYERGSYILRDGDTRRSYCSVAITGLAYRHKIASNGSRQIIGLVMPGEAMDFQQLMLNRYDHSIQAAANIEVAELERADLTNLAFGRKNIGNAVWTDALVSSSIYQEWLVNIGCRNAKSRIAHFFCEFVARADAPMAPNGGKYLLPMTQEQIGDATGLTSVHVNRMIKVLVDDKVIEHERPFVIVNDHRRLCKIAGFDPAYLHFDQLEPN